MKIKKPLGILLCGGGAFGSFQSGVLKKIYDYGLKADVIAGFSIGALNGAAYCFDKVKETKKIWSMVDNKKLFKLFPKYHNMPIEIYKNYDKKNIFSSLKNKFENKLSKMSLFSNKPVYNILENWLGKSDLLFNEKVVFHVIAHCVETKLPYILTYDGKTTNNKMNFIDALVASSSIPFVFPPVKIKDKGETLHLVDGGNIGIATINLNIFDGCETVIIISNSSDNDFNFKKKGLIGYVETNVRKILAFHIQRIYESKVFISSNPDVYLIKPENPLEGGILDFTPEICLKNFEYGEKIGSEFLRKIK